MFTFVVIGAKGRMGKRIIAFIEKADDCALAAGVDVGDDIAAALAGADAVIDFTIADASAHNAAIAADCGVPIVIGTTGQDEAQLAAIREASQHIPVVLAPNMSVGVNVLFALVDQATKTLGEGYAISIEETHHVHKKDAPSGTAKRLADISGIELGDVRSIREGEVVGDHEIVFESPEEKLILTHHAVTRDVFARGAITAAHWIVGKPAGLYGMNDVLGLQRP